MDRFLPFVTMVVALSYALAIPQPAQADPAPPASVATIDASIDARRAEALKIAERYATHRWRATEANVMHGKDPDGVRVDTPDAKSIPSGFSTDGEWNVGIPYQWGGACTLEEFDRGVAEGKYAGHLPKSRGVQASRHAVGVDCSGLVTVCWKLAQKQSTRSLGGLCYELDGFDDLQPGDILNRFDAHVMMFVDYADRERSRIVVYEAVTPRVLRREHAVADLKAGGYVPLRYRPFDPRWAEESMRFENPTIALSDEADLVFTPRGDATSLDRDEAIRRLTQPLETARGGDWVRYSVHSNSDDPSVLTMGLPDDDGDRLHVAVRQGDLGHELLDPHGNADTIFEAWMRDISPDSKVRNCVVHDLGVREGQIRIGDRDVEAARVTAELTVELPTARNVISLRVELAGTWSPEVALRGFVEVDFRIHVLGDGGESLVTIESSYRMLASHNVP